MAESSTLVLAVGISVGLWLVLVLALILGGRRADAAALARFVPDCIVLFRRLLRDPRVPRRRKVVLVLLVGYLAMPFDLVPDFIPVAGQLDDALAVAWALRVVLRGGGRELLHEHWPGPDASLRAIERIAFGTCA